MKLPIDIALHNKSREFELFYEEGSVSFSYEFLRVMSPSAEVQGHTPEEAVLQVGKRQINIVDVELVGNYALRITFSDGHDTGLYSWDYFEFLAKEKDKLWSKYLEHLKEKGKSREPF